VGLPVPDAGDEAKRLSVGKAATPSGSPAARSTKQSQADDQKNSERFYCPVTASQLTAGREGLAVSGCACPV